MGIKLVIDTSADLAPSDLDESVAILPIPVYFEDREYIPYVNLEPAEFYGLQRSASKMPHTSQVPYVILKDTFQKALDNGDDVIAIFIASKMSGTYNTARLVKEELGSDRIFLVDSLTVTFPYSALALEAYKMVKSGQMTAKEIYERLLYLAPRSKMLAVIDDLTYLKMGGRISGPIAVLANFFNFKPIIAIDDGVIHDVGKERGLLKAMLRMTEIINSADVDRSLPCYIGHTDDLQKAERLTAILTEKTGLVPAKTIFIGPTVGTHAGPGSTGVSYFIK